MAIRQTFDGFIYNHHEYKIINQKLHNVTAGVVVYDKHPVEFFAIVQLDAVYFVLQIYFGRYCNIICTPAMKRVALFLACQARFIQSIGNKILISNGYDSDIIRCTFGEFQLSNSLDGYNIIIKYAGVLVEYDKCADELVFYNYYLRAGHDRLSLDPIPDQVDHQAEHRAECRAAESSSGELLLYLRGYTAVIALHGDQWVILQVCRGLFQK
jgi:hypothetical protein